MVSAFWAWRTPGIAIGNKCIIRGVSQWKTKLLEANWKLGPVPRPISGSSPPCAASFFGAGLGAGIGGFAAWLHLDCENSLVLALSVTIIVGFGVLGAWGGYRYGSTQEVEGCAMPTVSPVYYTALGATVVANAGGVAFAVARAFLSRKRGTQFHNAVR